MVCNFLTLRSLHISSMILLMKLVPQSLRSLAGGPEDNQDVTQIQELGDCFSCLIGGPICHYMLHHEMVLEYQDIRNFRWSIQL